MQSNAAQAAGVNRRRRAMLRGLVAAGLGQALRISHAQQGPAAVIGAASAAPDYALINGRFIDWRGERGDTLFISNGEIQAVGRGLTPAAGTPLVDLGGRSVIPGLIDAHVHFTRAGVNPGHQERRVERAFSIPALQETLARRAAAVPAGEFITCIGGWNHQQFAERRRPTLAELDAALPDHPVYLAGMGGGTGALTNRLGAVFFAAHGVSVAADSGIVMAPNDALTALRSVQTDPERLRGTAELNAFAAGLGLTTVVNAGNFEDQRFALALWRSDRLDIRMRPLFPADSPAEVEARALNQFDQAGRAVGDGLFRPAGFGERIGGFDTTSATLEPTARMVARYRWLLQQHSITAAENEFHLDIFERINRDFPLAELHWALIHLREISAASLARLAAMGCGASAQTWTYLSSAGGPPFRRIVDAGLPAAVGTDSTNVSALDPWLSLFYMTTGRNLAGELTNAAQQISRLEALRLYTAGAAWFCHEDTQLGSFDAGRRADLAVLSRDFLAAGDDELRAMESVLTLLDGRVVHANAEFE